MSLVSNISGGYIARGAFDGNNTVSIQDVSFWAVDAYGDNVEADSIYVVVTDADDNTEVITDAITEDDEYVYKIGSIDVTGYPAGNITIQWFFTSGSDSIDHTQTVQYSTTQPVIISASLTTSKTSNKVYLDTPHQFSMLVEDATGTPVDGSNCRFIIYDSHTASNIETVDTTLALAGSGLWKKTYTLSSNTYTPALQRYQIYWEWLGQNADGYVEVANSREWLEVHQSTGVAHSGGLGYATPNDIRASFWNIDDYLIGYLPQQSDRDLVLHKKIEDVSEEIHNQVKNTKVRNFGDLLKQWCVQQVVLDIITTSAGSVGRFSDSNLQIKHIKQKIFRIKQNIFGRMRTVTFQSPDFR